ncbi:DUF1206 domain-containing protein [Microbacterium sp. I2]|uniref:DUF1206 domain-containing protein n=1 Tax=Microbacterium sp. I2 TaxID=3391826 RepID=UPI003EDA70FB
MARAEVRSAARRAEASTIFEALARGGYVADGLVHILIGVFTVVVAFGGDGETDQPGAFRAIAGAPLGFVVLWVAAIALAALGLWEILEGVLVPRGSRPRKWGARVTEWGKAAVFLALAAIAAAVAIGARPDPDESVQDASRGLLDVPGGPWVLGLIGAGIGVSGIVFGIIGIRRKFLEGFALPEGRAGTAVTALAVAGYVAKGVALVTVGVLLVVASVKTEADDTGGLDAALDGLTTLSYGPAVCAAIGVGLIAYGVFLVLSARFRRL